VESASGDEAEGIWNLLMSLPTNDRVENYILNNQNINELLGLENPQAANKSMYRILYCL